MNSEKFSKNETNSWSWIQRGNKTFLRSDLLHKNGFSNGFFTKDWEVNSPKELANEFKHKTKVHYLKQIHGNKVIRASKNSMNSIEEADSICTSESNNSLWVYSADCIPILFADVQKGCIAAAHAGWRGIEKSIVSKTLDKLYLLGAEKESILIAMGPAISGKNYQSGTDVIEMIYNSIYQADIDQSLTSKIEKLVSRKIVERDISKNTLSLDIRLAAHEQLSNIGIKSNQISICSVCTFSDTERFYSWRRDYKKNCQWSGIAS